MNVLNAPKLYTKNGQFYIYAYFYPPPPVKKQDDQAVQALGIM